MKLYKAIRSGTARSKDGAERDRGHIVHLVTMNPYPSWQSGICGVEPKGNGWFYPHDSESTTVTCKKCLKKQSSIRDYTLYTNEQLNKYIKDNNYILVIILSDGKCKELSRMDSISCTGKGRALTMKIIQSGGYQNHLRHLRTFKIELPSHPNAIITGYDVKIGYEPDTVHEAMIINETTVKILR